jgi:hypothetical protein
MRVLAVRPPLAVAFAMLAAMALPYFACAHTSSAPPPPTTLDTEMPRMVSAFYGLDNGLPTEAASLCAQAPGKDGLPVTFSRRVIAAADPEAFTVRLRSGALVHPLCATTKPANAPAKDHTILLIGELGNAATDPPVAVEVTGHVALAGGADAKGMSGLVTPLPEGPTLVLALAATPGTIKSDCPERSKQIVVAVWAGGVKPPAGADQAAHLAGYKVKTATRELKPFALGDLDDRDNYVHLCLDTDDPAKRVDFTAGILADPNGDLNPETSVPVSARL